MHDFSEKHKLDVITKLAELVVQYRKVSKIQISQTSNMVVLDNAKVTRKVQRIDYGAKVTMENEQKVKKELNEQLIKLRTYQDTRINQPNVTDGSVQIFTRENAVRKRKIRDLGLIQHFHSFLGHLFIVLHYQSIQERIEKYEEVDLDNIQYQLRYNETKVGDRQLQIDNMNQRVRQPIYQKNVPTFTKKLCRVYRRNLFCPHRQSPYRRNTTVIFGPNRSLFFAKQSLIFSLNYLYPP